MRKIKDKFIFSQSRHRVKHFEENEYAFLNQNFLRVKHFEENEYAFLNQNFLRECIGKRYSVH